MKCFNKVLQYTVTTVFLAIFGAAQAGSYEDFFKAIALDQPQTISALLVRGFDPNTVHPDGTPALVKALQDQSFKAAQALLQSPQIQANARNNREETALMLAALRGQDALALDLVARGAAINKAGWTPLHYAATGGHLRICAFLIGAGADVNAESPNGTTPLMMAAMYGNSAVVKLMLESGAEAYTRNDQGLSAQDFARKAGREDSARLIQQVLER
jgi:ankyrin repeat protein